MALRLKILAIIYLSFAFLAGAAYFAVFSFPPAMEFYEEWGLDAYLLPLALSVLALGVIMAFLVERVMGARVRRIREDVSKIGTSGDFTSRIKVEGKDDVSALVTEINGMLLKLEWSHGELKDREARLRQITDNMMDLISQIDMEGDLKFVSPSFKNIMGYREKELLDRPLLDFMHPEDHREFVAVLKNALQTSSLGIMEFRLRHASGHYLWMESIGSLLFDKKGVITGAIFGSRDVTERKRAEEALKESEEKYKQIVVDIEEGYFEADLEGRLTFFNPSMCKLTGFSGRELNRANSDVIFKDPTEMSHYFEIIYKTGKPQRGLVWTLEKKDKETIFVEVSLYSIKNKQGNPVGFRGLVRDVTESILAEQEIKKVNEELERRVAERTAQLEAANKELESFSYSVSHDLRAPLRSIDGFSTALMVDYGEELEPQARDYLDRVRAASQRMGQLIDDLLNLSRVMRSEMQLMEVDMSQLASEVVRELTEMEPDRQVEVVVQPEMKVRGDPRLLRIMLVNLLENAWKFTGKTPEARIEFGCADKEARALFFIRDNGAGFDMEYADKLFGPFQRLHSPSEFPGTGIGLATVARIIKRHEGDVWAEGRMGEGAVFYFTLESLADEGGGEQ